MLFPVLLCCIFVYVLGSGNTLTTSSRLHDDFVRPTVVLPRWSYMSELIAKNINEQALYNESSFRKYDYEEPDVRLSELWNWDYWCRLQPVVGMCDQNIRKFYFDLKTELCKPITYSGCNGGKNLFDTKKDCERTCIGANDMLKPTQNFGDQLDCFYQPDPGLCLGSDEQFFYDINLETCRGFIYGGCGGNPNRFSNVADCLKTCKDTKRRFIMNDAVIGYDR